MEEKGWLENLVTRIADASMRAASRLHYAIPSIKLESPEMVNEIISNVASQIAEYDGVSLRCKICGKGPFTRKGLYLHLKRVHQTHVEQIVRRTLEYKLWVLRNRI